MKTDNRQSYLLPHQHLGSITAHPVILEALRRARTALFIVWAIPVAGYIWRALRVGDWGWSLIGVAIGCGFGYMLWHAIVTGYTRNNHGEFLRATRPLDYWLSILFLVLGYSMGVAGLLFGDYSSHQ